MKIAILTLPLESNIGNILQAWALQTVLEDMGHSVRILMANRIKKEMPIRVRLKRAILKLTGQLQEDNFKHKNIKMHWIAIPNEKVVKNYDAIIAGSDQIWRKEYFKKSWPSTNPEDAFLAFCGNTDIRKIFYAASLGLGYWEYSQEETNLISKALSQADGISVREKSAIKILTRATCIEPELVLDPTLLIKPERYKNLLNFEFEDINCELVSYILDKTEDKDALIQKIKCTRKLSHTDINSHGMPIKKWIASIASSKMVVTDSFHGCVFAINFNKPLIFMSNPDRGNARFESLIQTFGIGNNMLTSVNDYSENMDYSLPRDIQTTIALMRQRSYKFLNSHLS